MWCMLLLTISCTHVNVILFLVGDVGTLTQTQEKLDEDSAITAAALSVQVSLF